MREQTVFVNTFDLRILGLSIPNKTQTIFTLLLIQFVNYTRSKIIHIFVCFLLNFFYKVISSWTCKVIRITIVDFMDFWIYKCCCFAFLFNISLFIWFCTWVRAFWIRFGLIIIWKVLGWWCLYWVRSMLSFTWFFINYSRWWLHWFIRGALFFNWGWLFQNWFQILSWLFWIYRFCFINLFITGLGLFTFRIFFRFIFIWWCIRSWWIALNSFFIYFYWLLWVTWCSFLDYFYRFLWVTWYPFLIYFFYWLLWFAWYPFLIYFFDWLLWFAWYSFFYFFYWLLWFAWYSFFYFFDWLLWVAWNPFFSYFFDWLLWVTWCSFLNYFDRFLWVAWYPFFCYFDWKCRSIFWITLFLFSILFRIGVKLFCINFRWIPLFFLCCFSISNKILVSINMIISSSDSWL